MTVERAGPVPELGGSQVTPAGPATYFVDPHEELIAVFMSQGTPIRSSISGRFGVLVYQALR